jgi:alpha-L-rhamnosidase
MGSVLFTSCSGESKVIVGSLRVETRTEPFAVDLLQPRLSWEIKSKERNVMQKAYRIMVASTKEKLEKGEADLWDSGKVKSGESIQIPYAGKQLQSRQKCFWKVRVWCGKDGKAWSETGFWQVGLLNESDWKAKWIGLDRTFEGDVLDENSRLSARYFRKEFEINDTIANAKLYISGLGLYELYINGMKVDNDVLCPAPTDYTQQVMYNTYDLTAFMNSGLNTVGVILGNGRFFNVRQNYKPWKIHNYGFPKMLFQLEIKGKSGLEETIISDGDWKVTADGPIRSNNEFNGEEYDSSKEFAGWNRNGFDDSGWLPVDITTDPGENRRYFADSVPQKNEPKTPHGDLTLKKARRVAQLNENMKIMARIKPVSINELKSGVYIMDMGQNIAGWLKIQVVGKKGQKIQLRFAESLNPDGSIYVENLRSAKATDLYILKGQGSEVWEPRFVYHGFRYVEITGWPGEPKPENFEGEVVSDVMATTGYFNCSDAMINAIYKNAWWSIAGNYKGMPVDCPQRDERQPWLGDRTVGALGESFIFDNQRLYAKWLDDIQQAMSQEGQISDVSPNYYNYYTDNVTWPATYFTVADMLYQQFGDLYSIKKHYPSMKKWMNYMKTKYMKDNIMTRDKYGDWCMPPESPEMIHAQDPARITDGNLIATAYFYKLSLLMKKFAGLLELNEEAENYQKQATAIADAFQKKFYNAKTRQYGNNTATANILPLAFGLVPESDAREVFKNVEKVIEIDNKGHISTGVIGTAWLMRTLCEYGRGDLAFKIATNKTYPGWGYMVEKGATTIWELWNGDTANPKMNSQNHVMLLGDLIIWYYENLAGIKCAPDSPGFSKIIMKPDFPMGLSFVSSSYKSMRGLITSNWKKGEDSFKWEIEIPANSVAEVYLPGDRKNVYESNMPAGKVKGLKFLRSENGRSVFLIGSGTYRFEVKK